MRKTAQQKFNEYLEDYRKTTDVVNQMIESSNELYGNYAYATGYLSTVVQEVIAQLPRAKREELRQRFARSAEEFKIRKELA